MDKDLKQDILIGYRAIMHQLYRKYNNIPANQIRMDALSIITQHVMSQTKKELAKKTNPSRKINRLLKLAEIYQRSNQQSK